MTVGNVTGVRADISEMLNKIRDTTSRVKVFDSIKPDVKTESFSHVMETAKSVIGNVNSLQVKTDDIKDRYLQGDPNVSLAQVVVSSEKSKMAFEGLIIVRNKCLEAYKEIMSMPV